MKKLLSIILTLMLLLTAVCGCDGDDKGKEESKPTTSSTDTQSTDTSSEELTSSEETASVEDTSSEDPYTETVIETVTGTASDTASEVEETTEEEEEVDPDKEVRENMQGGVNFSCCEGGMPDNAKSYVYQREYYDLVADAGFNNIRFPVGLGKFVVSEAPEYLLDTEQLRRLDIAVNHALDAGLTIAIDNHGSSASYKDKELFVRVWEQIAERYRYYPSELIFELINEPSGGPDAWLNEVQMAAVEVIRKTNPTRNIVLAPNQWNGSWKLWDAACPSSLNENGQIQYDQNVIFAVHMYNPMSFTHQQGMSDDGHESHISSKSELTSVTNALEVCADYEERTGRTVWINEWGAYQGGHRGNDDCMKIYYDFVTSECARLDLAYAVWEFNQGFGIYNNSTGELYDYLVDNMVINWK